MAAVPPTFPPMSNHSAIPMTRLLLAVALTAAGCSNAAHSDQSPGAEPARAVSTITPDDLRERIGFLASDSLKGRDTPSEGLETAAAWIADEFASFGLEPGADDGWLQRYPYPLEGLDADRTRFEISGGATHALDYGADFFVQSGSAPAQAVGALYLGDAVDVSRAPEGGLRDQAVIVRLDGQPESGRRGFRFSASTRRTISQTLARAGELGAAAVVFVMDPAVTAGEVSALAETAGTPSRSVGGQGEATTPAAFFVTRSAAERMFRMAGLDGPEQLRRHTVVRPVPLPGVTLGLGAPIRQFDQARPPNVVGILPGSDPQLRDTYIVFSAHMDHVGVGRPVNGDSIYNGADDDASGTSAIVEIAEAFAALPQAPRRSLVFLAVSGEEKGLLGSRWFADHPTIPMEQVVANLNIDMIGRNAPDSIVVIGQEYSSLGPRVHQIARENPELGLTISEDLWPEERFFFRSDHFSFAAKEVPALFFFAGTHEDYHRPDDEADEIDYDKNARVARLVFLLGLDIAQDPQAPRWDPEGLEEVRRLTGSRN